MTSKEELFKLTFTDPRLVEVLSALKEGGKLPYSIEEIASSYRKEIAIGERATHELAGLLCSHFWDAQVAISFHAEGFCLESHHPKVVDVPLDDGLLGKIRDLDEVMGWQALGECDNDSCHSEVYPDKSYLLYKPRERAYDIKNGLAHKVDRITTRIKGGPSQIRKIGKLLLGEKEYVLDLRGIRFICPDEESCDYVSGFIDGLTSLGGKISLAPIGIKAKEDFIRNPLQRENGTYQSLHRNVIYTIDTEDGQYGIPIEIQIRDWNMHRKAEVGEVSHEEYTMRKNQEMLEKYGGTWTGLCREVAGAFSIDCEKGD